MTLFILLFACVQSDLDSGVGSLDCSQDCARPECVDDAACEEIPPPDEDCTDGIDNDGDGAVDCADADCSWQPVCAEDCDDGQDNDHDGLTDCLDPDCSSACPEDCFDGQDNDTDGRVDCEDPECTAACPEDCEDGTDNNADGLVDCADPDCSGLRAPCIEVCDDAVDNDLDGLKDCFDSNCEDVAPCIEDCADGLDNDADGLMDCEDADCQFECSELSCTDGLDNNGNGRVDCADEQCWGLGDCPSTIGIRVHSAQVDQQSFYWTTGASGKESHSSVQYVDVNSPSGRIYVGLDDSNLSCAWWAKQIRIEKRDTTWKTFTWGAQTSSARDQMAFSGFESTGACEPYFETSVLSFHTQDYWSYTNDVVFHHGLDIQAGQVSLESAVWLAGAPKHTGGSSTYFYSFQVDPLLTAPWVIGP